MGFATKTYMSKYGQCVHIPSLADASTDLEYVEGLKLDILALIPQEVHHHLQVRLVCDVPCHDVEVCPIQQDLAEELQRLSLRDIVL